MHLLQKQKPQKPHERKSTRHRTELQFGDLVRGGRVVLVQPQRRVDASRRVLRHHVCGEVRAHATHGACATKRNEAERTAKNAWYEYGGESGSRVIFGGQAQMQNQNETARVRFDVQRTSSI